ncbi:hypothetical protein [Bowmanella denitrificans]|uniref:hypothetical protein n=1 Tax=Bowmanella denitrificans TaxID=366582 RepID=UPI000C9BC3AC|nr:hypothetical protein [Bowmanella denitrificans]
MRLFYFLLFSWFYSFSYEVSANYLIFAKDDNYQNNSTPLKTSQAEQKFLSLSKVSVSPYSFETESSELLIELGQGVTGSLSTGQTHENVQFKIVGSKTWGGLNGPVYIEFSRPIQGIGFYYLDKDSGTPEITLTFDEDLNRKVVFSAKQSITTSLNYLAVVADNSFSRVRIDSLGFSNQPMFIDNLSIINEYYLGSIPDAFSPVSLNWRKLKQRNTFHSGVSRSGCYYDTIYEDVGGAYLRDEFVDSRVHPVVAWSSPIEANNYHIGCVGIESAENDKKRGRPRPVQWNKQTMYFHASSPLSESIAQCWSAWTYPTPGSGFKVGLGQYIIKAPEWQHKYLNNGNVVSAVTFVSDGFTPFGMQMNTRCAFDSPESIGVKFLGAVSEVFGPK